MTDVDDGGGAAARRPKWEVYADDQGNMYFYNTATGETAWELPTDDDGSDQDEETNATAEIVSEETVTPTGETLVSNQMRDGDGNELQLTVVRPRGGYSQYQIAVEVIETMLGLTDAVIAAIEEEQARGRKKKRFVSPAAEKRAKKNDEAKQKKLKRERLLAMTRYMNILIPPVTTASAALTTDAKRPVGALFTREDARKWRLEREVQQIRQRFKVKKQKERHHQQVYARATHHQFLKQFRIELLKHFIAQIPCSSELQQQSILLLTTPQQLAEMELQRKATLEPEMLERFETEKKEREAAAVKNIQKVFVLADRGAVGSVHLLQTLFTIFSDERTQKFATKVRGLSKLISDVEIQRFVVDFVSSHHSKSATMSLPDFHEFVQTIEEVLEHYEGVKAAVKEAEEEIAAAIEASTNGSGSNSLLRARLNMVSTKKVEQEMAALKAVQVDLEQKKKRDTGVMFNDCSEALLLSMAKEEWEKHHQHRYIQIDDGLPVYCCLCRRRKWEMWRQGLEQEESDYRATYSNRHKLKLKSEELRIIREQDSDTPDSRNDEPVKDEEVRESALPANPTSDPSEQVSDEIEFMSAAHFRPRDEDENIVLQIVRTLVLMTERIHSDDAVKLPPVRPEHQRRRPAKQLQTGSPKKKTKKKRRSSVGTVGKDGEDSDELDELQVAMKEFENEDSERKLMVIEDSSMNIFLERNRRLMERPRLLQEDAAHNAYIRLISHCVNPSSLLYRLQVERCLSFSPPQHLVLLAMDGGQAEDRSPCRRYILHTVPCRTEQEATFVYQQIKSAQDNLKSQFVAGPISSAKHSYQFFAESGMLIESWPVVFIVVEYFVHGSWGDAFKRAIASKQITTFADAEARIIRTFRDVAAGLAAMHSGGILHLNLNLQNLYLLEPMEPSKSGHPDLVQIGGLLAYKRSFHEGQLRSGEMAHCLNPVITPPEATSGRPVSGKADAWMLGCALYEALMIWQRHDLSVRGIGQDTTSIPSTVLRLKNLPDVFQEIPLATSAPVRSLLRMLLQPNPSQRPHMSQVVDILSFAGKKISGL